MKNKWLYTLDTIWETWVKSSVSQSVQNLSKNIVDSALGFLSTTSSRHWVLWTDVLHLNSLELKYLRTWDKTNFFKSKNIRIYENVIDICGLVISRFNEQSSSTIPWKNFQWEWYFAYESIHLLKSEWKRLLNKQDIEFIFDKLPWVDENEKVFNFMNMLNFWLSWIYNSKLDLLWTWKEENCGRIFLQSDSSSISWLEFRYSVLNWWWWRRCFSSVDFLKNIAPYYHLAARFVYA